MFSIFTGMYYVYTISVNGIIFYVGMTMRPCSRFVDHYTDRGSAIYKITRYLLLRGIVCDMEVIHCCDSKGRCLRIETNYINELSKHYFLVNTTNYIYWQHIITYDEVYRLPFTIIHKLQDSISTIEQQTERLNKLWQTI